MTSVATLPRSLEAGVGEGEAGVAHRVEMLALLYLHKLSYSFLDKDERWDWINLGFNPDMKKKF